MDPSTITLPTEETILALYQELGLYISSPEALCQQIRQGLPTAMLVAIGDRLGLDIPALLKLLKLPADAAGKDRLTGPESERLYRLISLYSDVLLLFQGDTEAAKGWLTAPAMGVGDKAPVTLLATDAGIEQVRTLVGRLEHGVAV